MNIGAFIWAKRGGLMRPAVVVRAEDAGFRAAPDGMITIYWFGDDTLSVISLARVLPFAAQFRKVYLAQHDEMGPKWNDAVLQTIIAYSDLNVHTDFSEALGFAVCTYQDVQHIERQYVPLYICIELSKMLMHDWTNVTPIKNYELLVRYKVNSLKIDNLCLGCYSEITVADHPIFKGRLCTLCKANLNNSLMYLPTNKYKHCVICGNAGNQNNNLTRCEEPSCRKPYCVACVRNLFTSQRPYAWLCPVCLPDGSCFLEPRPDQAKRVVEFIAPNAIFMENFRFIEIAFGNILILFHGKSTVLPMISHDTDTFSVPPPLIEFARPSAMTYPFMRSFLINRGTSNARIVDVDQRQIHRGLLNNIGVLDIVIGGTSYKGLKMDRTPDMFQSKLFWEFLRIYNNARAINHMKRHVTKFIFEMRPAINKHFSGVITKYLGVNPYYIKVGIDEYRLIWTNLCVAG